MTHKRTRRPALTEAQLEIMNVVWDEGSATVSEVRRRLSSARDLARNTVQTMMSRLEEKGWLTHEREGNGFRYLPAVPRDGARRTILDRVVDKVFDGSAGTLVATLLDGRRIEPEEAERIRELLDSAEEKR